MHAENQTVELPDYDVVVVGGGPAGATAATDMAGRGARVLLLERGFRIKPCGGAIPPRAVDQFEIPPAQIVARIKSARMISPADERVNMSVGDTYVAMVDRDRFDPFLRERAQEAGATLQLGAFKSLQYRDDGRIRLRYLDKSDSGNGEDCVKSRPRAVIGADGAKSRGSRSSACPVQRPAQVRVRLPRDRRGAGACA
jgi:geranylgeranyl reductase